jgi:hypothetical protein
VLLALAGCGDALVDARYAGEPLVVVQGSVLSDFTPEELNLTSGALAITLDWAELDEAESPPDVAVRITTDFPARYTLRIYGPPPAAAFFDAPWSEGGRIAVATPLLYMDDDGDGQWDAAKERVVGGAHDIVLLFTHRPVHIDAVEPPDSGWAWQRDPATGDSGDSGWRPWGDSGWGPGDSAQTGDSGGYSWYPDREPVTLEPGYHKMFTRVDFCDGRPAPVPQLLPASEAPVDLSMGPLWSFLTDWDCDGRIDDWFDSGVSAR